MSKIILYDKKTDCCGCGACVNICPKNAINMAEDSCGFVYPEIDEGLCVECRACKRVCSYQNREEKNIPLETFASVSRNRQQARKSASGGIFASLANRVLMDNGVVFGAAFDEDWSVKHIGIDSTAELYRLQGSKYVQSSTGDTFKQVKKLLSQNKRVLYSGTPCQIAGLYGFLGKDYDNLITIDIICHGVPSDKMLKDYLSSLEKREGGKLKRFTFRDKSLGWGINGRAVISLGDNEKSINLFNSASPYLYYFTKSAIYRENCYSCKYACKNRPADITLGDYWGIEKVHADYLGKDGWNEEEGISVIICNTEKGKSFISEAEDSVELKPSEFIKASAHNGQLNYPSSKGQRDEIISLYREKGWEGLECRFNEKIGLHRYVGVVKSKIPKPVKRFLKKHKG